MLFRVGIIRADEELADAKNIKHCAGREHLQDLQAHAEPWPLVLLQRLTEAPYIQPIQGTGLFRAKPKKLHAVLLPDNAGHHGEHRHAAVLQFAHLCPLLRGLLLAVLSFHHQIQRVPQKVHKGGQAEGEAHRLRDQRDLQQLLQR